MRSREMGLSVVIHPFRDPDPRVEPHARANPGKKNESKGKTNENQEKRNE